MSDNAKKTNEQNNGTKSQSFLAAIFDWANTVAFAIIVVLLILTFVFKQVTVNGPSMNDTLQNGDRLIVTDFMYEPHNGDIIVASHGKEYNEPIIKRIIATSGQSISVDYDTGNVCVDGVIIDEKYIKGKTIKLSDPIKFPVTIPEGYVFVMGDNREDSIDSRTNVIGMIPVQNIIGKAIFRVYPFNNMGQI